MCIIFLARHHACKHKHFIGSYSCGLKCTSSARHTFKLDSGNVPCVTCQLLDKAELDLVKNPVQRQDFKQGHGIVQVDNEVDKEKDMSEPRDDEASEDAEEEGDCDVFGWQSPGALSDADSETEYWKLDKKPLSLAEEVPESQPSGLDTITEEDEVPRGISSGVVEHRALVKQQLENVPVTRPLTPAAPPFVPRGIAMATVRPSYPVIETQSYGVPVSRVPYPVTGWLQNGVVSFQVPAHVPGSVPTQYTSGYSYPFGLRRDAAGGFW